jgi:hypothetical protein
VSSVPFTRTLSYVLREKLDRTGISALIAKVSSIPDGKRVTIDQAGVLTTIPRISSYVPTVGEPVVCLAGDSMILAIGAVGGVAGGGGTSTPVTFVSGTGPPTGAVGADGAVYLDRASLRFWGPKASGAWPGTPFGRLVPLNPTYAQIKAG